MDFCLVSLPKTFVPLPSPFQFDHSWVALFSVSDAVVSQEQWSKVDKGEKGPGKGPVELK